MECADGPFKQRNRPERLRCTTGHDKYLIGVVVGIPFSTYTDVGISEFAVGVVFAEFPQVGEGDFASEECLFQPCFVPEFRNEPLWDILAVIFVFPV